MKKANLLLVDAKYLMWRSVMANPVDPVSLWFYYFLSIRNEYLEDDGQVVVCWDDDDNETIRRKRFPDYKRARGESRNYELLKLANKTKDNIKRVLDLTTIRQAWSDYWEADDVIATLVQRLHSPGIIIFIFSADKDFYQILSDEVMLVNVKKGQEYAFKDRQYVEDELGIEIKHVHLLKAIAGDSSDGIPGIYGIGPKKGVKLLKNHNYNLKSIAKELNEPYDKLKLYKGLVKMQRDVKLTWKTGKLDHGKLVKCLLSVGAKGLLQGHRYKALAL